MEEDKIRGIYKILDSIKVTKKNEKLIEEIREELLNKDYMSAYKKIDELSKMQKDDEEEEDITEEVKEDDGIYPPELSDIDLEQLFIGILLNNPKLIVKYYFPFEECYFEDSNCLNAYKSILFTEGGAYSSEDAKRGFNFAKDNEAVYEFKMQLKNDVKEEDYDVERIYIDLRKLFILRKSYLAIPIKSIQDKVVEITEYTLYDKMSVEEVKSAIEQVNATEKFKRAVLNKNLTTFLESGENNLRNGLSLPFPILTSVFKGIRKGETMAFAMPSNSGKSRFTIDIAANVALVHKKKVLIISNEMSEEKMKLCLITTIINNKAIQELHGVHLSKTEGELLEFKFRADKPNEVETDEDGFIIRKQNEKQGDFVKRLTNESEEFRKTIQITNWANKEMKNAIYFINITDHTNDELKKVIMNYYYKEQIEYVFYDTLKTDTANIGIGEELKKTATILSNLAQNFN